MFTTLWTPFAISSTLISSAGRHAERFYTSARSSRYVSSTLLLDIVDGSPIRLKYGSWHRCTSIYLISAHPGTPRHALSSLRRPPPSALSDFPLPPLAYDTFQYNLYFAPLLDGFIPNFLKRKSHWRGAHGVRFLLLCFMWWFDLASSYGSVLYPPNMLPVL